MTPLASTLPSNDGYVAAAYIVFFVLVLAYVAIMAVRLSRVERKLTELQQTPEQRPPAEPAGGGEPARGGEQAEPAVAGEGSEHDLEREPV